MGIEQLYHNIWLWSSFVFCLIIFLKYINSTRCTLLEKRRIASIATITYLIVFTFWMGFRPMDLGFWADSSNYRRQYNAIMGKVTILESSDIPEFNIEIDTNAEWLWNSLMTAFAGAHIDIEYFFFVVECGYTAFMYLAIRRLTPCNQWMTLLFCISSFFFFSFSYNGLRNGVACSIMLFALTYLLRSNKTGVLWLIFWTFIAMGIHRSAALPALCALVAYFTKMNFKLAYSFWLLSIILSLIAGTQIQSFFANIGFDDRMQTYVGTLAKDSEYSNQFSHTGFRWDFLLFSAVPIVFSYYIVIKKKIRDRAYELLIVTYTLANSFWVMVIQSSYSNRFAYLSWFMYPIVLAYPLLKIKIWKDQDRKTVQILMLYVLFTVVMNVIYW